MRLKYEKFLICVQHQLILILYRLNYILKPYRNMKKMYYACRVGYFRVNGMSVQNPAFSVWVNDLITVAYKHYFYRWWHLGRRDRGKVYSLSKRQRIWSKKKSGLTWNYRSKYFPCAILVNIINSVYWLSQYLPRQFGKRNLLFLCNSLRI